MLYIRANINKVPIQAFVDTGAQSTIMSESLATRCGYFYQWFRLMRLVDKRYAGTAVGVGSCKILGKIHAADIEIEGKFLTCSFTIIENNSVEFLLGLDMMKRFSVRILFKVVYDWLEEEWVDFWRRADTYKVFVRRRNREEKVTLTLMKWF